MLTRGAEERRHTELIPSLPALPLLLSLTTLLFYLWPDTRSSVRLQVPALAWAYQTYRAQLPPGPGQQLALAPKAKVGVLDVLTADRRASIWYTYAREVPSLVRPFSASRRFSLSFALYLEAREWRFPTDVRASRTSLED